MTDPMLLLSYGIFFAGVGFIAWWATTLDKPKKQHHPAPGE
jgi:hypothetical protein